MSFLESESEVRLSGNGRKQAVNLSNPLLTGAAAHHVIQSAGRPIATSTPVGTPARNNIPPLSASAIARPFTGPVSGVKDAVTRCV